MKITKAFLEKIIKEELQAVREMVPGVRDAPHMVRYTGDEATKELTPAQLKKRDEITSQFTDVKMSASEFRAVMKEVKRAKHAADGNPVIFGILQTLENKLMDIKERKNE